MMDSYPLVIVGGGPVGLILLMALRRAGIPVVLFDENAPEELPVDDRRSIFLTAASMAYLSSLGFSFENFSFIDQVYSFSATGWSHLCIRASDYNLPHLGCCASYPSLLQSLRGFVHAHHRDCIVSGTRYVSHEKKGEEGVFVSFLRSDASSFFCVAEHLIITCRLPTPHFSLSTHRHYARLGFVSATRPRPACAYEVAAASSFLALLPLSQDIPQRFGFIEMTAENEPSSKTVPDSLLCHYLQKLFGHRLGSLYDLQGVVTKEIPIFYRHHLLDSHRVLLMGGSAQLFHPIAAQGINFSIFNIRALIHCMRQSGLWTDVLADYERGSRTRRRFLWNVTNLASHYLTRNQRPFSALEDLGLFVFNGSSFLKSLLQPLVHPHPWG